MEKKAESRKQETEIYNQRLDLCGVSLKIKALKSKQEAGSKKQILIIRDEICFELL